MNLLCHRLWFLLLDFSSNMFFSIFGEVISYSQSEKGQSFKLSGSYKWLHNKDIYPTIPHDLSEQHSIRNRVLLVLGMKFFLESLKSVEEDDFRQIYLFNYHHFIHAKSIFITYIVYRSQYGMPMLNKKLWMSFHVYVRLVVLGKLTRPFLSDECGCYFP